MRVLMLTTQGLRRLLSEEFVAALERQLSPAAWTCMHADTIS
jgi:hypothetical protein